MKKSIAYRLVALLLFSSLVFGILPNLINSFYLFSKYDEEVHYKNQTILDEVTAEFEGMLGGIEGTVDTFDLITRKRFGGSEEFLVPDLNQEELYYEGLFRQYLKSSDARSTSVYIYFDPELDPKDTHDVWIHDHNEHFVREKEYVWEGNNNPNTASWFFEPKNRGYSYWVDPYRNRFDEYITSYVNPVFHNGHFIGIIGMYLELETIIDVIEGMSYYQDDLFWIYNREGEVIYHPDHPEGLSYLDFTDDAYFNSSGTVEMDGTSYYTYKAVTDQEWTFLYSIPVSSLNAVRYKNLVMVLAVMAGALVLLILFTLRIARRYKKIFDEIITALGEIKEGNLGHKIKHYTDDEIGLMIDALNDSNASLKTAMDEKNRLAYSNSITGMPNRNQMLEQLKSAFSVPAEEQPLSLFYVDIDQFRLINDLTGYGLGNKFIQMIGEELTRFVDRNVTLYHTSVDEFVFLIEDHWSNEALHTFAADILRAFGRNINFHNHRFYVTLCIGIVNRTPQMDSTYDMFIAADIALESAKNKGRNQLSFYDHKMYESLMALNELERDFAVALKKDQFILHYQPKINLSNNESDAMEALVRWQHPKKGLIYPGDFIDFAEKSGLIINLGDVVLTKACQQLVQWQKDGEPQRRIAVNVSIRQLIENDFVHNFIEIIRAHEIDPSLIELEITESMFMEDSQNNIDKLLQLNDYGVRITMDDFGTGFASLSTITKLPLNALKIDRSMISNCTDSDEKMLTLKTIIDMAGNLHLEIIAEGVETEEEKNAVEKLGCTYIQGYYYAKPMDADALIQFCKMHSGTDH